MFYHLSSRDLGAKFKFEPRIPAGYRNELETIEDQVTPRVCFSLSIKHALKAIAPNNYGILYVYFARKLPGHIDVAKNLISAPNSPGNKYGPDFSLKKYNEWAVNFGSGIKDKFELFRGLVPDVKITKEQWATKPVLCIKIMKIEALSNFKYKQIIKELCDE